MNATGVGAASVSCHGGNCTMNCKGAGACLVGACGGKGCKCNKLGNGACTGS